MQNQYHPSPSCILHGGKENNLPFILFSEAQLLRSCLSDNVRDSISTMEIYCILCYSICDILCNTKAEKSLENMK